MVLCSRGKKTVKGFKFRLKKFFKLVIPTQHNMQCISLRCLRYRFQYLAQPHTNPQSWIMNIKSFLLSFPPRAREIDKCQSVHHYSKWLAISGRTYGNSWLDVCPNICYIRLTDKPWQGALAGILVHIPLYCPFPYFLNICLQKTVLRNFRKQTQADFDKPTRVVLFEFSQRSSAKCCG